MLYDPVPVFLMQCNMLFIHVHVSPVHKKLPLSTVIAIIRDVLDVFLWAIEIGNDSGFLAIPPHVLPILLAAPVLGEFASGLNANASS